ncbi:hypothetical protein ColLi_00283 [Colletotrichum liriopes]|uniref:Uncharacterized protein n=1 Tax=Colletotrichum liriopes TaxID=708192 RepID=A0AA37GB66_9PEZI|nr:hypothetical protein ColLi_00283 [Colletotrichum liriopes]
MAESPTADLRVDCGERSMIRMEMGPSGPGMLAYAGSRKSWAQMSLLWLKSVLDELPPVNPKGDAGLQLSSIEDELRVDEPPRSRLAGAGWEVIHKQPDTLRSGVGRGVDMRKRVISHIHRNGLQGSNQAGLKQQVARRVVTGGQLVVAQRVSPEVLVGASVRGIADVGEEYGASGRRPEGLVCVVGFVDDPIAVRVGADDRTGLLTGTEDRSKMEAGEADGRCSR